MTAKAKPKLFYLFLLSLLFNKNAQKCGKITFQKTSQKLNLTGDLSASDTSLVDLVERHRGPLPQELMPLPSSDRDSPLEWTHLVDVANTFENERNTHYGIVLLLLLVVKANAWYSLPSLFCLLSVQRSFVFGDSNHRSSGASSPQQSHIDLKPVPLSRPSSRYTQPTRCSVKACVKCSHGRYVQRTHVTSGLQTKEKITVLFSFMKNKFTKQMS